MSNFIENTVQEILEIIYDNMRTGSVDENQLWDILYRKAVDLASSQNEKGEILAIDVLTKTLAKLGSKKLDTFGEGDEE